MPAGLDGLEAIELVRVRLPLLEPFVTAHGTEIERDVVLVRALADGAEGWGECSALSQPTYTAEHTAGAWAVLRDELAPAALRGESIRGESDPMARAALDTACRDLVLRRAGRSLVSELGGTRAEVETVAVLGRAPAPDVLVDRVAARVAEHVAGVKLKIAPDHDVAPLRAVRERWPDLWLAADANGSYGNDVDSVPARALDALDLAYIEQPLATGSLDGLARLAERIDTPIALDETATSPAATDHALDLGCARVVNVKPARVGGVTEAAALVHLCEQRGVATFVGGMLETGVGRAAALAVASMQGCTLPTDLGPSSRYFADDITRPIETSPSGLVRVPEGPGIGVVPRADRLDVVVVDRLTLLAPRARPQGQASPEP